MTVARERGARGATALVRGATLLAAAAALAALAVVVLGGTAGDLVFAVVLLASVLAAGALAAAAARTAHSASRTARELTSEDPGAAAARAVSAERVRLALDVQAAALAAVDLMRGAAAEAADCWDDDPGPALAAVQLHGRRATIELRRLLGLLREDGVVATAPGPQVVGGTRATAVPRAGARPRTLDVVLGALAVLDALAWWLLLPRVLDLPAASAVGGLLTCVAAATLVGRSVAPGPAALVAAAAVVVGTVVGRPVTGGLWVVLTVGGLAWACGAREPHAGRAVAGPLALAAAFVHLHREHHPENLGVTLLVLAVGYAGGLVLRLALARADAAGRVARARRAELAAATDEALRAERAAVARELHDAVSGGVGVAVVQAGAAEALRGSDDARARRALAVAASTCDDAATELGRLMAGMAAGDVVVAGSSVHGLDDLAPLVARMRATGLDVDLVLTSDEGAALPPLLTTTAYRVVQEALTNVLRHASASHVRVEVTGAHGGLAVEVRDDGLGAGAHARRGYGLVGLAERVGQAGGSLTTGPAVAGRGFVVRALLPAPDGGSRS